MFSFFSVSSILLFFGSVIYCETSETMLSLVKLMSLMKLVSLVKLVNSSSLLSVKIAIVSNQPRIHIAPLDSRDGT